MIEDLVMKGKLEYLYKQYCEELDAYCEQKYPEGQDEAVFREYVDDARAMIRPITLDDELIGFIITLRNYSMNIGEILIIAEAYIIPKYRRQGFMRRALSMIVSPNINEIEFMVYDKNPALGYWRKMMEDFGFVKCYECQVEPGLTEYAYARNA